MDLIEALKNRSKRGPHRDIDEVISSAKASARLDINTRPTSSGRFDAFRPRLRYLTIAVTVFAVVLGGVALVSSEKDTPIIMDETELGEVWRPTSSREARTAALIGRPRGDVIAVTLSSSSGGEASRLLGGFATFITELTDVSNDDLRVRVVFQMSTCEALRGMWKYEDVGQVQIALTVGLLSGDLSRCDDSPRLVSTMVDLESPLGSRLVVMPPMRRLSDYIGNIVELEPSAIVDGAVRFDRDDVVTENGGRTLLIPFITGGCMAVQSVHTLETHEIVRVTILRSVDNCQAFAPRTVRVELQQPLGDRVLFSGIEGLPR